MSDERKNIDNITRTLTSLVGTERLAGRDGTGDFKILASVLAQLAVSDLPIGTTIPFSGISVPSSYLLEDGSAISRTTYAPLYGILTTYKGVFTVTIATPAVFTLTGHGLSTGDNIELTTTGTLPTGIGPNVNYYIIKIDANTFNLATSRANAILGTKIATSGSQSGVHSLRYTPYGISGSTNFLLPDTRGGGIRGVGTHGTEQKADGNYYVGQNLGVPELDKGQGFEINVDTRGIYSGSGGYTAHAHTGTGETGGYLPEDDGTHGEYRSGDENNPFTNPKQFIIKYE